MTRYPYWVICPWSGKAGFQSKVTERTKKNLLLFVTTARLIRSNGKPQYIKTLECRSPKKKS